MKPIDESKFVETKFEEIQVPLLEETDLVRGGEEGESNAPIIALAKRTGNLNARTKILEQWKKLLTEEDSDNIVNTMTDMIAMFKDMPENAGTILEQLSKKQDSLTIDGMPIYGSNNPVSSGGVFEELNKKANNLCFSFKSYGNPDQYTPVVFQTGGISNLTLQRTNVHQDVSYGGYGIINIQSMGGGWGSFGYGIKVFNTMEGRDFIKIIGKIYCQQNRNEVIVFLRGGITYYTNLLPERNDGKYDFVNDDNSVSTIDGITGLSTTGFGVGKGLFVLANDNVATREEIVIDANSISLSKTNMLVKAYGHIDKRGIISMYHTLDNSVISCNRTQVGCYQLTGSLFQKSSIMIATLYIGIYGNSINTSKNRDNGFLVNTKSGGTNVDDYFYFLVI